MFWTRLLSGIVLLAIALATFSFGNVFLAVPLWLISLIAYRELTKALKCATDEKKFNALEWIGFVGVTAYYATLFFTRDHTLLLMCIVALFMAEMFCYVAAFPKYQASQVMAAVFSAEPVVGSHQHLRLSLFHRGLEAGEIELSERPLVHGSLHIEPACLLIV